VKLNHLTLGGINYRFSSGEHGTIDDCIAILTSISQLVAIDRQQLTWFSYANFRYDGYWQGKQR
jgi:hypothetical protein